MEYALLAFAIAALGGVIGFAAKASALAGQVAEQRARADRAELDRDQARKEVAAANDRVTHLSTELAGVQRERDQLQAELLQSKPGNQALAEVI